MRLVYLTPRRTLLTSSVTVLFSCLFSCGIHPSDQAADGSKSTTTRSLPSSANSAQGCTTDPLMEITKLVTNQCVGCHGPGGNSPDLSSTSALTANKAAIIASTTARRMPPSGKGLSAAEQTVINTWAASTALNFALVETTPTYEGTIKGIIGAKCVSCHSATAPVGSRQTPYLTTYAAVKSNYANSIEQMNVGTMPPRGSLPALIPSDATQMVAWKAAGYPVGTPPPPVDTTSPAVYFDAIKTLMVSRCAGCHSTGLQGPDLSTYDLAKAGASRSLIRIQAGTMPPGGALPAAESSLFATWIADNFPIGNGTPEPAPAPAAAAGSSGTSSTQQCSN